MDDWEPLYSRERASPPEPLDDPYPDWGFDEIDQDIPTVPGEIESNGDSFPYERFGVVDAGGTVFVDAYTPDVFGHWLAIADDSGNSLRSQEIVGSDGTTEFDLGDGGDGDRLAPGAYVIVNANSEIDPRALQPLCVQAYSGTIQSLSADPVPEVTVTLESVVTDPPGVGTVGLVLWTDTTDVFVGLTETSDGTFEGDLSGVDPGTYTVHALVADDTAEETLVGLSGTATAEVVAQTGLTFAVDGQSDSVTIDDGDTVPYTATAEYEDGRTDDVTGTVSVAVSTGDSGAVDIDEGDTQVTAAEPGSATLEADDGEFTDTVGVTVDAVLTGLTFEIDGQQGAVTVDEGATVPYAATAVFSDGGEENVTDETSVTSADSGVVSVDQESNQVSGEGAGEGVAVTADYQGETDTVDVTVPAGDGTEVTVQGETIPPGGEATLDIVGSEVETVTLGALWTDWGVVATDPAGAETTDSVASTGEFELSWESQQSTVAPTIAVTPADQYVGGEFELTATGVGPDGSTVTDAAVLTIDSDSS